MKNNLVTFRLDDENLLQAILRWCAANDFTMSQFIRNAIREKAQRLQLGNTQPQQQQISLQPQQATQDKLMAEWTSDQRREEQRLQSQYQQEFGKPSQWMVQDNPPRWRR
jgi:hypothetical protein